jgi:tetratricopeptide (TPR) repeat protein
MRTRAALVLGFAALVLPLPAADAFHGVPAVRAGMLRATDLLLNLDLEAAERECRRLLTLPDGEAPGRFCLGLVAVGSAEEKDDPAPDLARFRSLLGETIAAAHTLARRQPADAGAKVLLGLAHGSRAMLAADDRHYLEAVGALRQAHREFEEALQLDPTLADPYYGLGLYKYSIAHLPALLRPLVATVLPRGDAKQGLRDLERVARHGTFLKMAARMALLRIYTGPERRYADAFALGQELVDRYPGNPDLYFATAHAASELGRFPEAMSVAQRLSGQIAAGHPRFPRVLVPRYHQLMGKLYMDQRQYEAALGFFDRTIQSPTPERYRWVTAWAWVRSGMIHDALGDREEAVRRYRETLALQSDGLASTLARRYLDAPYRGPASS